MDLCFTCVQSWTQFPSHSATSQVSVCVFVCPRVCVSVCVFCVKMYLIVCAQTCVCMRAAVVVIMFMCMRVHACMCVCVCTRVCVCVCMCVCVCVCVCEGGMEGGLCSISLAQCYFTLAEE